MIPQHNAERLRSQLTADPEALGRLVLSIWGAQRPNGRGLQAYWLDHGILVFHGCSDLFLVCWRSQSASDAQVAARMLVALGQAYRKIVGPDVMYHTDLVKLPTPHLAYLYHGGHHNPAVRTITLSEALAMPAPGNIELRIRSINLDASSLSTQFPELNEFAIL